MIEQDSITNISNNNFIWYYDPILDKIEWVGLIEIVKNLITEQYEELLDPVKIICGCSIVPFDSKPIIPKSSFYDTNSMDICVSEIYKTTDLEVPKIGFSTFKFFQEKKQRSKKHSKIKLSNLHKKPKIKKKPKSKSKRSKSRKKTKNPSSKYTKRYNSIERGYIPKVLNSSTTKRSKSYRITAKPKKSKSQSNKSNNNKIIVMFLKIKN